MSGDTVFQTLAGTEAEQTPRTRIRLRHKVFVRQRIGVSEGKHSFIAMRYASSRSIIPCGYDRMVSNNECSYVAT
jgi:hypothetical protein